MKLSVRISRSSPTVEAKLLVRFVIHRCREVTEPPAVLVALALAALSGDDDYYNRLKEIVSSSDSAEKILRISKELLMPSLGQIEYGQSLDDPERDREYPFPDEATCQEVLHYAFRESRKMLTEKDFEFVRVIEFLIRAGLEPYSFRLYQFEDVRETFRDDPESLVRKGVEIIRAALGSRRMEK